MKSLNDVIGELNARPRIEKRMVEDLGVEVFMKRLSGGEYLDQVLAGSKDRSGVAMAIAGAIVNEDGSPYFSGTEDVRALPAAVLTALHGAVNAVNSYQADAAKKQ